MPFIEGHMYFDNQLTIIEYNNLIAGMTKRYGALDLYKVNRIIGTVQSSLLYYRRVRAFRVDLRFANDYMAGDIDSPSHFQQADPKAITRFFESLKSQFKVYRKNKNIMEGKDDFKYIWVREKDGSCHHHYHLVLLFDRGIYYPLGDCSPDNASGIAAMIQKAWCSALRVSFPEYATLVHYPDNCAYNLEGKYATLQDEKFIWALERFLYLSKVDTKTTDDGFRNFGCSQFPVY